MRVRFSTEARHDQRRVHAYYRSKSPSAAARFREQLDNALRYISEYPEGAESYTPPFREKIVLNFPYTVVYKIAGDHIKVVAIASHYQRADRN